MCAVDIMTAMTITKPERTTRRVVSFFTPSQEARLLALAKKYDVTAAEVLRQAFDQFVQAMDSKRKSA
jgi:putative heme iron utilization protein